MTPEKLLAECEAALTAGTDVVLVFPKGTSSRIKGFPRGELLCENPRGERVYRFNAARMKATALNLMRETDAAEERDK